jgi:two-component system, NtrC family, response regulator PilR
MVQGSVIGPDALEFPETPRETDGSPIVGGDVRLDDQLAEQERRALEAALAKTAGNRTAAARMLGLSFRQMRYRLRKLGLD